MMDARTITLGLGGRWYGSYGTAKCPAHPDRQPSLSISAGLNRAVLVRCFAGCSQESVIAALRSRGLWTGQPSDHASIDQAERDRCQDEDEQDRARRITEAREIWRGASPIEGSLAEVYLRWRRITIDLPPSLRCRDLVHIATGLQMPAMIAAVQDPDGRITAIHRTWLRQDGRGKAEVQTPKMALGPIERGAVRLAAARSTLGIAEGIETALSAMQIYKLPCWCALGSRLAEIELPDVVRSVIIFADNGDAGHRAAERAAERFRDQGRQADIQFPDEEHGDFNDSLGAA